MEAIASLERWYRPIAPGEPGGDGGVLRRWAAAWFCLPPLVVGAASVCGRWSWWQVAALASVTLVAGVAALAWWTCRDVTARAVARCVAVAAALGASSLVVVATVRRDAPGGVALHGWLVPPLVLMLLSVTWAPSWTPSARGMRRLLLAVLALAPLLAGSLVGSRLGASRVVLPPVQYAYVPPSGPSTPGLSPLPPWSDHGSEEVPFAYLGRYSARAGATLILAAHDTHASSLFPGSVGTTRPDHDVSGRLRLSPDGRVPDGAWDDERDWGGRDLPWDLDEPVEVLRDLRTGDVTIYSGEHAARFRGARRVAAWRTVAGSRGAVGLLVAAFGGALAFLVWGLARRAVARVEPLASWREGELSPDGTIQPIDGGASARASGRTLGLAGRVVFRSAAAPEGAPTVPYRDPAPHEVTEAHRCTREELAGMIAHVREAWGA